MKSSGWGRHIDTKKREAIKTNLESGTKKDWNSNTSRKNKISMRKLLPQQKQHWPNMMSAVSNKAGSKQHLSWCSCPHASHLDAWRFWFSSTKLPLTSLWATSSRFTNFLDISVQVPYPLTQTQMPLMESYCHWLLSSWVPSWWHFLLG